MGHGAKVATSLLVARTSPTLCCTPYRSECLTPRRRPLCMIVTATTAGSAAFRSFANRFASASGSFIPQPRFGAAETKTSMQHYSACGRTIRPLASVLQGGTNELLNVVVTCAPCNYGRMQYTIEEAALQNPLTREPRRGPWDGLERLLHASPAGSKGAA